MARAGIVGAHAGDLSYFLDRLDDPSLLEKAFTTDCRLVCVPVGGKRRAGEVGVYDRREGKALVKVLSEYPEAFPNARIVPGHRGYRPYVEWGEPQPTYSKDRGVYAHEIERGHPYGYSDQAIAQFMRRSAALMAMGPGIYGNDQSLPRLARTSSTG